MRAMAIHAHAAQARAAVRVADERSKGGFGLLPLATLDLLTRPKQAQALATSPKRSRARATTSSACEGRPSCRKRLRVADPALDRVGSDRDETLELLARLFERAAREEAPAQVRARGCEARIDLQRGTVVPLGLGAAPLLVGQKAQSVMRRGDVLIEVARSEESRVALARSSPAAARRSRG